MNPADLPFLTQAELLAFAEGLWHSLLVSSIGMLLGMFIGITMGALRHARLLVISTLAAVYVNVFRCTPLLVQIFLLYFALPEIGIRLSPFQAAFLSLGLWGGAYQCEVMRAGFDAVPRQQILAARALGLPALRTFLTVVLPIGFRTSLPSATTTALTQFRSSSFMIVISYTELTYVANRLASDTFEVFRIFGTASLIYLGVSFLISSASRQLESYLRVPGLGAGS